MFWVGDGLGLGWPLGFKCFKCLAWDLNVLNVLKHLKHLKHLNPDPIVKSPVFRSNSKESL